jgi:hypothetical protein
VPIKEARMKITHLEVGNSCMLLQEFRFLKLDSHKAYVEVGEKNKQFT